MSNFEAAVLATFKGAKGGFWLGVRVEAGKVSVGDRVGVYPDGAATPAGADRKVVKMKLRERDAAEVSAISSKNVQCAIMLNDGDAVSAGSRLGPTHDAKAREFGLTSDDWTV